MLVSGFEYSKESHFHFFFQISATLANNIGNFLRWPLYHKTITEACVKIYTKVVLCVSFSQLFCLLPTVLLQ